MENNQEIFFKSIQNCMNNDNATEADKNIDDTNWGILDTMCNKKQELSAKTLPINGSRKRQSSSSLEEEEDKKPYRLLIQIDKIRLKPGPKSEKLVQARRIRKELLREFLNENGITVATEITENNTPNDRNDMQQQENHHHDNDNYEEKIEDDNINVQNMSRIENLNPGDFDDMGETAPEINPCEKGCLLVNAVLRGKPVLHCVQCNKYYMPKKTGNIISGRNMNNQCLICKRVFGNSEILKQHIKHHLSCGVCGVECMTKANLEQHTLMHVGRPPHFPYKCHLCTEVFRREEHVRSHLTNKHYMVRWTKSNQAMKQDNENTIMETLIEVQHPLRRNIHRCIPCNITFRNEEAFGRHVNSHKQKEVLSTAPVFEQLVPISPLLQTSPSLGQLRPVKFTCRVCSQELTSVAEIDVHTKSHMVTEAQQSHKCNVCEEILASESLLNEHVREHLAKAHRCPICSKAFINKVTLKNHLKTHRSSART